MPTKLTVTLPDGTTASRRTDADYRFVVAVHQPLNEVRQVEGSRIDWNRQSLARIAKNAPEMIASGRATQADYDKSTRRLNRENARCLADIAQAEANGGRWLVRSWHTRMDLALKNVTSSSRVIPVNPQA